MRITIALAIYVSLATFSFADSNSGGKEIPSEWRKVYDAGLAASEHQNYTEALVLYRTSWENAQTAEERGAAATDLGQTYRHLGQVKEATQWFDRALRVWKTDPRQGSMIAATSINLADLYRNSANYEDAERVLREGVASSACDANQKAIARNNLADLLREEGRGTEAEPLFKQTAEDRSLSPQNHANALIGLADLDRLKGAWQSSVDRWNQVLEIVRSEKDEKTEPIVLRGLAMTWLNSGSTARAEPLLRRSLRMLENNPDTPQEQIASVLAGLGELYRAENKLTLAEEQWSRALRIDTKVLGESHPQVAWLMEMLSEVFSARGEFSLAREYVDRASVMMTGSFGENSMPVATALTNRALVEERASQLGAAAKDYERAIGIARSHPEYQTVQAAMLQRYAGLLKAMHRGREAKAVDIEARSFRLK